MDEYKRPNTQNFRRRNNPSCFSTGATEAEAIIKDLDGADPLLYAASRAIGSRQLTEEETRNIVRRVFRNNPKLSSSEIGKAIGRLQKLNYQQLSMILNISTTKYLLPKRGKISLLYCPLMSLLLSPVKNGPTHRRK